MTIRIPQNVFEGLVRWMARDAWPQRFQEVLHEHFHAYCDLHDLDSFDELADMIGGHWVTTLNDSALNDFLSRDMEEGNVVDLYLKRRGWNEKKIAKGYMEGIRSSVMSLYEVSDVRPGDSFLARDLVLGGEPVRITERSGTKSMAPWAHFAMRVIEVRGQAMLAGGLLPFEPDLSARLVEEIHEIAECTVSEVDEIADVLGEDAPPEAVQLLTRVMTLKMAAPLFSEAWLLEVAPGSSAPVKPQLFNSDGDEVEFVRLHARFRKGATQAKIRAVLGNAADMVPASDKAWNWVERGRRPLQKPAGQGTLPEGSTILKSELDDGSLVLATILLKGRMLEAETNSAARATRLQARLEELVDDLAGPLVMVRQTLEQAMTDHQESGRSPEPLDIPPEEEGRILHDLYDRHYRDALDQPIGMLDDRTPRQAARSKTGRRAVAAWLKYLENGEAKTRVGKDIPAYDFSWMWAELGVEDLRI